MKKAILISISLVVFFTMAGFSQSIKLVSTKSNIKFFSATPAENIEANNTAAVSTINKESGAIVFSIPMQGFEFDKSMMQKHYNSDKYLNTSEFPKTKLKAKIVDIAAVDFSKDGVYAVEVEGDLTLKGETNPIKETGSIIVKGSVVEVKSTFNLTLADYGVVFEKGKPSSNIAKTLEITVHAEYQVE